MIKLYIKERLVTRSLEEDKEETRMNQLLHLIFENMATVNAKLDTWTERHDNIAQWIRPLVKKFLDLWIISISQSINN